MLTIKEFSESTGFSIRMLRYLEEFDLLEPTRGDNNYRHYRNEQVDTAKKIKMLQNLGFQLQEIKSLADNNWTEQIKLVEKVFNREREIAEIKSEILPQFKTLIEIMRQTESDIFETLGRKEEKSKGMTTLAGAPKFQRTAFHIPALRMIYDHLSDNAKVNFTEIDFMKFGFWVENCSYAPEVYSFLDDSSFAFGSNFNENFLSAYKSSWMKYLPGGDLVLQKDFQKEDVIQLMGSHDIVIRAKFEHEGAEGEIVIPYAPVFAMAKLR